MKSFRGGLIAGLSVASLLIFPGGASAATVSAADADGTPQQLTELTFGSQEAMATTATTTLSTPGWTFGAQGGGNIGVQETAAPTGNGATVYGLEGTYPVPTGGNYIWANYNVAALNTADIYIEFWAKMPGAKEGCKFVKVFGQRLTSINYADTTIYTDYTGVDYGAIRQVAFGDGSSITNDSQRVIMLDGSRPQLIGRSYRTASVRTPQMSDFSSADWGTGWHHFLIHVKFNSGTSAENETPNGEYFLEIDGKVYVDATGLYNRNPANGPIASVGFFGWAQTETQSFQLWYSDIRISTGGFMSQPMPDAPADVGVK